ncbi:hypothetical protein [Nonlabens antarcticus]|uniref:hypothetical protein n=1 Tax=Nonlabens antarcticus TaxID=392714 RepID=UPI00189123B4|nr:hypothetical protein [Nonlabens antarcticus]
MEINHKSVYSHVRLIRWITVVFTVTILTFIFTAWFFKAGYESVFGDYNAFELLFIPGIFIMAYAMWITWTKLVKSKSQKRNDTFCLLLLGVFGVWMWMPSKDGIKAQFKRRENPFFGKFD